jgi:outer membrane receptor protein involved in Fe transport
MRNLLKTIGIIIAGSLIILNTGYAAISDGGNNAETGKITGKIQDAADKESLPYATVVLYSKKDSVVIAGTVADYEGNFTIDKIPNGEYYIEINSLGYNKKIVNDVIIKKGSKLLNIGNVVVDKAAESIEEVEIVGEKDAIEYKIDKKVINVSKKPVAAGGTVVDALENTPSVQIDAEGNVSLRGSQNFTVLVDGKPTALSGNDALKSIPASTVENVEIITNPSVKYDPDGTAGIINIIMKKGYQTGTNGIFNASIGSRWLYTGDFNINIRKDKVNYFVGAGYNKRPNYPHTLIENHTDFGDTIRYVIQDQSRSMIQKSYNIKAGADFYLNEKNTLTLTGDYGLWAFNIGMETDVSEWTEPALNNIFKYTDSDLNIEVNYINGSLIFDHDFGKNHDLVTTFTYSTWNGSNISDVNELDTESDFETIIGGNRYRTIQDDLNQDIRIKTDYVKPIGETSKIEAGLQARIFNLESSYMLEENTFMTDQWAVDPEFDNSMDFSRTIASAYFTYSGIFKGFQYQIGLRGEYTDRLLHVLTTDDEFEVDRFDYFPSVHISRQLKKGQQFQASYSRRINRPQAWNLNPFPVFSDSYYKQGGNPELLPEYTDSYELNYMKRFKIGFMAVEGFYRQTNNNFQQTISLEDDLVSVTTENIDKSFSFGTELSGNFRFNKWLNVYASANLYSFNLRGELLSETADIRSFNYDFVLNSTFSITKTTKFTLTGFYRAPTITAQGLRSEIYGVNVALSQNLLKNKLSLTLRARDVLQTMKFNFLAETEGLYTNFNFKMDSPIVVFSVSYKLNNYKQRRNDPETETNFGGGIM